MYRIENIKFREMRKKNVSNQIACKGGEWPPAAERDEDGKLVCLSTSACISLQISTRDDK